MSAIVAGVVIGTLAYAAVQTIILGRETLYTNIINGLFFVLVGLAVLIVVAPVVVKLFKEDVTGQETSDADSWMTRIRTLVTVSLTIILLVFVLTWFTSPERLSVETMIPGQVGEPMNASSNATAGSTVGLHPFVKVFFDAYTVVIAFYFSTSAAQTIANKLAKRK